MGRFSSITTCILYEKNPVFKHYGDIPDIKFVYKYGLNLLLYDFFLLVL